MRCSARANLLTLEFTHPECVAASVQQQAPSAWMAPHSHVRLSRTAKPHLAPTQPYRTLRVAPHGLGPKNEACEHGVGMPAGVSKRGAGTQQGAARQRRAAHFWSPLNDW